ncbi:MAG: hemerythrin family protein [Synergistaceae bacterium]|jgi:hemerythrin|nr:hemerythrin family protein [Synergistaceae bacterium]
MLWNKNLETGVPAIDIQHKELFHQIDILSDNNNKDRFPQTVKFLGDYVKKHFADEQALHAKANYPKAEQHKKMHVEFAAAFEKMRKEYEADSLNLTILHKITKTVFDWLKTHIMVHDKEFAVFYTSKK